MHSVIVSFCSHKLQVIKEKLICTGKSPNWFEVVLFDRLVIWRWLPIEKIHRKGTVFTNCFLICCTLLVYHQRFISNNVAVLLHALYSHSDVLMELSFFLMDLEPQEMHIKFRLLCSGVRVLFLHLWLSSYCTIWVIIATILDTICCN